jgi:hypothetical protein
MTVPELGTSDAFHAAASAWAEAYRALVLCERSTPEENAYRIAERWQTAHQAWYRRWVPLYRAERAAYEAMRTAARAIGGTVPPRDRLG